MTVVDVGLTVACVGWALQSLCGKRHFAGSVLAVVLTGNDLEAASLSWSDCNVSGVLAGNDLEAVGHLICAGVTFVGLVFLHLRLQVINAHLQASCRSYTPHWRLGLSAHLASTSPLLSTPASSPKAMHSCVRLQCYARLPLSPVLCTCPHESSPAASFLSVFLLPSTLYPAFSAWVFGPSTPPGAGY